MKSANISASLLEKLLILLVLITIIAVFGIYTFLSGFARSQAQATSLSTAKAESSQKDIDNITASYKWMSQNGDVVAKTNKIVAEATFYKYQDQVINDLESYANQSGVKITSYMFSDTSASAAGATGGSSASPSTSGGAGSSAPSSVPKAGAASSSPTSNFKTATIQVSLDKGTRYNNFVKFLKKIEQNVTRIQINNLDIAPDTQDPSKLSINMTVSVFLNK